MGGRFSRALVPFLCGVLGVLVANLPVVAAGRAGAGAAAGPGADLFLVPGAARPDDARPRVFAIGVLQDIMSGGPPGVWTAVLRRRPMP